MYIFNGAKVNYTNLKNARQERKLSLVRPSYLNLITHYMLYTKNMTL